MARFQPWDQRSLSHLSELISPHLTTKSVSIPAVFCYKVSFYTCCVLVHSSSNSMHLPAYMETLGTDVVLNYIAHLPALYHQFVNGLGAPRRGRLDVTSFGM